MRLGYFTMPMHPLDRDYTTTLKQDRETIMLCDALGYHDAFVGEHLTDTAIDACPRRGSLVRIFLRCLPEVP